MGVPTPHTPQSDRRYTATVKDVAEVFLRGPAAAEPWCALLETEALVPYQRDGHVELTILACGTRYMGIRFQELSVSLAVSDQPDGSTKDAAYLAHAFNTVRFFAFSERVFFKTPYDHADVAVTCEPPSLSMECRGAAIRASRVDDGTTSVPGDPDWAVPIYLPRRMVKAGLGRWMFAHLTGAAEELPFSDRDTLEITPGDNETLERVVDSGFAPDVWSVRTGGVHSRSKSYPRPA